MDESLLHTLVVPTCQAVLAGLMVGFMVFQVIESVGRLASGPRSGPAPRPAGSCDGPRHGQCG